jgi:hypothetical protein
MRVSTGALTARSRFRAGPVYGWEYRGGLTVYLSAQRGHVSLCTSRSSFSRCRASLRHCASISRHCAARSLYSRARGRDQGPSRPSPRTPRPGRGTVPGPLCGFQRAGPDRGCGVEPPPTITPTSTPVSSPRSARASATRSINAAAAPPELPEPWRVMSAPRNCVHAER